MSISTNAKFENDPAGWVENVTKEFMWSKQREVVQSVNDNRYTAVQSAHDTGKSFSASRLMGWWIDTKPDPFVVTTAPTWKQVNSILWREARRAHRKGNLMGRINLDAEWYMGSDELVAFGRKPADYDQSAFQGIHALNVLVLIDEACGVPQSIFEAADSLATNERARVLAIGNPDDPASYFAKVCQPGSGWNVIKISAFDTPAFTREQVPEELYDLLVSPTWVTERKRRWGVGSPTYISKVKGEFPDIGNDTLLSPRLLREAQEREIKGTGSGQVGMDVARFGDDYSAIYRNRSGKVRCLDYFHKMDTQGNVSRLAKAVAPYSTEMTIKVDSIGLGAGVYDTAKNTEKLNVSEYMSSWAPNDTERFADKRAEDYWHLREMAENGELDLPPFGEDEDLIAELGAIKWEIRKGKIAIESKEKMKERGLPSPNRADAVAIACSSGSTVFVPEDLPVDADNADVDNIDDLLEMAM